MNVTIGILAGGGSLRMGRPKALIVLDGQTLIERAAATAAGLSDQILILGTPPFELPSSLSDLPVIEDVHPGIGPIAGLEAALTARPGFPCLLLACDMPFLVPELLGRLYKERAGHDAVVTRTGGPTGTLQPCCAVYEPTILPTVCEAIQNQRYGMKALLSRLRLKIMDLVGSEERHVENWNEPSDLGRTTR